MRRTLEKSIDQGIVRWAKVTWPKMVVRKLSTLGPMGTNGDPDRLFVWAGKLALIEMKAPGGTCTELQLRRQEEWRAAGAKVIVTESVVVGKTFLKSVFGRTRTRPVGSAAHFSR